MAQALRVPLEFIDVSGRYRAILGPFDWSVWLALTVVYLLAIFPLAFSNTHSLWHLLEDPWELENMFWYVFGTFTNAFTFTGRRCWSNSTKTATRMLIGSGGWERWFHNSSDAAMNRVLERIELVPDVHAALHNVTSSWRRSYAFLGPRALLDFIIRTNYSVRR